MTFDVSIQYQEPIALIDVRGKQDSMEAVLVASGMNLPVVPNAILHSGSHSVFRSGRHWCIIMTDMKRESELIDELNRHCRNISVQCTWVTDAYRAIALVGPDAKEVLSQVTSIDLHQFEVGSATVTELFSVRGFVVRKSPDHFSLYCESSYADYTMNRLRKCALHH